MERYQRALYVNIVAFLVLVPATFSGVVLWLCVPGGAPRAGRATFWSLTRRTWIDVHLWTSVVLVLLIGGHLLLHVSYIENVPRMLRRG
jgi:hypothetical protein